MVSLVRPTMVGVAAGSLQPNNVLRQKNHRPRGMLIASDGGKQESGKPSRIRSLTYIVIIRNQARMVLKKSLIANKEPKTTITCLLDI
jgi:hypothetical protein